VKVETDFWNFAQTAATGGNVEVQKHEVFEGPSLRNTILSVSLFEKYDFVVTFFEKHNFVDFLIPAPQRGVCKT
jgi:hypothetical protein